MNTSNSDEKSSREAQPDTPIPEQDTIIETSTPDELEIIQETRSEHHRSGKSSKKTKSQPRHPSKEEILSRLAEKNQIIVQLNKTNFDNSKKIQELEDKYLRSLAEFENYRKRTRKEWELLQHQAKAEVILEVLNVLDDFERAFSAIGQSEGNSIFEGFRLIYNNLVLALERFGVKTIEALNQPFNPVYHMAVAQVDSEDAEPSQVVEIAQKGYMMGDIVIRPAKVIIAK